MVMVMARCGPTTWLLALAVCAVWGPGTLPTAADTTTTLHPRTNDSESSTGNTSHTSLLTTTTLPPPPPTPTLPRPRPTAEADSSLWLGVGVGAGGTAGLALLVLVGVTGVLWRRGWRLPCGPRDEAPSAAYEGLEGRHTIPCQVYQSVGQAPATNDVYQNPSSLPATPHTAGEQPAPTTPASPTTQPVTNTLPVNGRKGEGETRENVYENYTPSTPRKQPGHPDPQLVQPAAPSPSAPLPPPRPLLPPTHTATATATATAKQEEDAFYMDMSGIKPASPTKKN
ncbi:uncharacterized protein LOC143298091 [Babylonia areolata]|uniref:uncharacterized protein LOC143298091 n=1 Tax=Babylonia areolata TaxID=304850 RepID=UPI003FD0C214